MRNKTKSRRQTWHDRIGRRYLLRPAWISRANFAFLRPLRFTNQPSTRVVNVWAPVLQASLHFAARYAKTDRLLRFEQAHLRSSRFFLQHVTSPNHIHTGIRELTRLFDRRTNFLRTVATSRTAGLTRHARMALTIQDTSIDRHRVRVSEIDRTFSRRFLRVEAELLHATSVLARPVAAPRAAGHETQPVETCFERKSGALDKPFAATNAAAAGMNVDHLAEQVIDRIDRRMIAWRERVGRTS